MFDGLMGGLRSTWFFFGYRVDRERLDVFNTIRHTHLWTHLSPHVSFSFLLPLFSSSFLPSNLLAPWMKFVACVE